MKKPNNQSSLNPLSTYFYRNVIRTNCEKNITYYYEYLPKLHLHTRTTNLQLKSNITTTNRRTLIKSHIHSTKVTPPGSRHLITSVINIHKIAFASNEAWAGLSFPISIHYYCTISTHTYLSVRGIDYLSSHLSTYLSVQ